MVTINQNNQLQSILTKELFSDSSVTTTEIANYHTNQLKELASYNCSRRINGEPGSCMCVNAV